MAVAAVGVRLSGKCFCSTCRPEPGRWKAAEHGAPPPLCAVLVLLARAARAIGVPPRAGRRGEAGGPLTQGPRSADQARRRSDNGDQPARAVGLPLHSRNARLKASARGSGPRHVAASRTAIAFLPIHPPREAARLKGWRTPWAAVGASSLAALPLVTTRARWRGKRWWSLGRTTAVARTGSQERERRQTRRYSTHGRMEHRWLIEPAMAVEDRRWPGLWTRPLHHLGYSGAHPHRAACRAYRIASGGRGKIAQTCFVSRAGDCAPARSHRSGLKAARVAGPSRVSPRAGIPAKGGRPSYRWGTSMV